MKKLFLNTAGISDVGVVKDINEDCMLFKTASLNGRRTGIFAVADGVGGCKHGEIASGIVISNLEKCWEQQVQNNRGFEQIIDSLINCIEESNYHLLKYAADNFTKIATTLSVLFVYENKGIILHVGDSRIYRVSGGINIKTIQLTRDHSTPVRITAGEIVKYKSMLTQCLGNKSDFSLFKSEFEIKNNDILLVCSDGIYKQVSDKQIGKIARKHKNELHTLCQSLIDEAKKNGETDNITVIASRYDNKIMEDYR